MLCKYIQECGIQYQISLFFVKQILNNICLKYVKDVKIYKHIKLLIYNGKVRRF